MIYYYDVIRLLKLTHKCVSSISVGDRLAILTNYKVEFSPVVPNPNQGSGPFQLIFNNVLYFTS